MYCIFLKKKKYRYPVDIKVLLPGLAELGNFFYNLFVIYQLDVVNEIDDQPYLASFYVYLGIFYLYSHFKLKRISNESAPFCILFFFWLFPQVE